MLALVATAYAQQTLVQKPLRLKFQYSLDSGVVELGKEIESESGARKFRFTKIKQYVSNITLFEASRCVWRDTGGFYLVDAADAAGCQIGINYPVDLVFDEISLVFGIDSTTQAAGVMGGALDPLNGMYWTWQSGYIHLKIEGEMLEQQKSTALEYHIGGLGTAQLKRFGLTSGEDLNLVCDLNPLLEKALSGNETHLMSPGKQAIALSEAWMQSIRTKP
jgi:hypothetical protein